MVRRLANSSLQNVAHRNALLGCEPAEITEGTKHGLMWCQIIVAFAAQSFTHGTGQDPVLVRNGGDDAGNQIILQFEERFRSERALIRFRPQMRSGNTVYQLYGKTQF